MLYVFNVNIGAMFTFDMCLAVESVNQLMLHIQEICSIPSDRQVLLISGGEVLPPTARVCAYSAGTDTNPIYLFNLNLIEASHPPLPHVEQGLDIDFNESVKELTDMPATYTTVCQRTSLAQQFFESAAEIKKICENIIHDQHLQHQGYAAAVANYLDTVSDFRIRTENFQKKFADFLNERESYLNFLQSFHQDLQTLAKVPILPALSPVDRDTNENEEETKEESEESVAVATNKVEAKKLPKTLLDWISAEDNKKSMNIMFQHCTDQLEKVYKSLETVVNNVLVEVTTEEKTEIRGLTDRLCGLDKLLHEAKKSVQDQSELAQSFSQNQTRAGNIGDTSILPDLCASHRKQLKVMLDNHNRLLDNRRRCVRAKGELGEAIHRRLKWIVEQEDKIRELNHRMIAFCDHLQRVRDFLRIVQQIHLTPAIYLSAVAEVVRRRAFSQAYLSWASELACYLLTIHNDEITRRKEFHSQFDTHFLNSLFPGMDDMPPAFATEAPTMFDSSLPKLTIEDIEQLKRELPEFSENISVPDIAAINNLFMVKSFVKTDLDKIDNRGVEEKIQQVVNEVGLANTLDRNLLKPAESETCLAMQSVVPHLKDLDKGCESETDTEEFEKVGQSPMELHFEKDISSSPRPRTHDASTLTEVGERTPLPPRKPPRAFQKPQISSQNIESNISHMIPSVTTNATLQSQRTMSCSGSQSNTESFTNVKNPSLESIDELSSIKNFNSNTESCFNSHHQQMQSFASAHYSRSKSLSPHTPQSPKDLQVEQLSPSSPIQGHQPNEFITDEFYIDESLPSSLSIEAAQSQGEFVRQLDTANNVVALLQDNLQTSRGEHDRLKTLLIKMAVLARQAIGQLRSELHELRTCVVSDCSTMSAQYESLTSSWENLTIEVDNKEKEIIQKMALDHKMEIEDFKRMKESKKKEVMCLQNEVLHLEKTLENSTEEIYLLKKTVHDLQEEHEKEKKELKKAMEDLKLEKQQYIKELSEKLIREHKAEIETIISRFRLMSVAKMEKSPSESNLDGIERGGTSENKELTNHGAIIMQLKENYEIEKQKAVNAAILQESRKWESILNEKLNDMKTKHELEKEIMLDEAIKKAVEEKDKQIDLLRLQEKNVDECINCKSTMQRVMEKEHQYVKFQEKVEYLEREKSDVEVRFDLENSRFIDESTQDMNASVAVCEGKINTVASPRHTEKLTKSQTSLVKSGRLSIDSCHAGDAVLVLWDPTYKNYRVIQESNHLYFLHSDCLEMLNVNVKGTEERKTYFTGEVIEKDYCHAKKVGNRYNVPRGTKFFRVTVKPLSNSKELKESRDKSVMSQSETAGPSSISEHTAPTCSTASRSLPVTPLKQSPTDADKTENDKAELSTENNR